MLQLATSFQYHATYHMDGPELVYSPRPLADRIAGLLAGGKEMLWTITVILLVLWLLGVVSGYTLGNWIYMLLVLAVVLAIFNLLSGRRAL